MPYCCSRAAAARATTAGPLSMSSPQRLRENSVGVNVPSASAMKCAGRGPSGHPRTAPLDYRGRILSRHNRHRGASDEGMDVRKSTLPAPWLGAAPPGTVQAAGPFTLSVVALTVWRCCRPACARPRCHRPAVARLHGRCQLGGDRQPLAAAATTLITGFLADLHSKKAGAAVGAGRRAGRVA